MAIIGIVVVANTTAALRLPRRRAKLRSHNERSDHASNSLMQGIRQKSEKEEEQEEGIHTTHLFFLFPFPIQRLRILDAAKKTREELGGEREGVNNPCQKHPFRLTSHLRRSAWTPPFCFFVTFFDCGCH